MLLARHPSRFLTRPALGAGIAPAAIAFLLVAGGSALAQTGTISGTVTDTATGEPLANVRVEVYYTLGSPFVVTTTNSAGAYATPGVSAYGAYYVRTNVSAAGGGASPAYLDEVYNGPPPADGLPCWGGTYCYVTNGAAVAVVAGQNTANIDFSLALGGRISGTIADSTGAPMRPGSGLGSGYGVLVYDASGAFVGNSGEYGPASYTTAPLAEGFYFVRSANNLGYLNELYAGAQDGLPCNSSCTVTAGTPVEVVRSQTTPNINFALALSGRISGTVTDSSGSVPLGGVTVLLHNSGLALVASYVTSATTGAYTLGLTSALPDGQYYVRTQNTLGYLDELYDNLPCPGSCTLTTGTPVSIVGGVVSPATVDFRLASGASFKGTVTGTGGAPLGSVTVQVYSATGALATSAVSNPTTGAYATPTLAPGSYYLRTSNSLGYIDQLYQNIPCAGCAVTTGTLATLAAPTTTIDLALVQGARLSGVVRSTAGVSLGGGFVQVLSTAGVVVTSASAASGTGVYTTGVLNPGSYFVRTTSFTGYVNQLYDGIACEPTCTVTIGTPLALGAGTTTLDFSLAIGARITGTVTGGGSPLANVVVEILNSAGSSVKSVTTNTLGNYVASSLPTGSYFVRTSNSQGFLDEVYNDIPCLSCAVAGSGAAAVQVTAGGAGDASISFDLARGGQITGRVSDAATGAGVPGVNLTVVDAAGRSLSGPASTLTNLSGNYATTGLPAGRYFVRANPSSNTNYLTAVYDTLVCVPCSVFDGLPVEVTLGAVTGGIDIPLQTGGRIAGKVTGGSPPAPLNLLVEFLTADGVRAASIVTGPTTGTFTSGALPSGTYFAQTRALSSVSATSAVGYVNEVFDDVRCSGCNPVTGTPITVSAGLTTPNINFVLEQGGRASGHVSSGGQPVQGVTVQFYNQSGLLASTAATNAGGDYSILDGLAAGDYYARTQNGLGYINRLYDVVPPCFPSCTPTSGTAIHVPATGLAGNIDFVLARGARISGRVTDASTGLPLAGVVARVYDGAGIQMLAASTPSSGAYTTGMGLPAGDYYVGTTNVAGYINEVHPGTPCLGCSPRETGSPVVLAEGATVGGIDFALARGGRIAGTVVASAATPALELPLKGVVVEVFAEPYLLPAVTGTTDRLGRYLTGGGLPDGTAYTVRTTNSLGFINERHHDISCIDGCSPLPGGTVSIVAPSTTGSIDFSLDIDGDQDADGIIGSIDTDKAAASDAFSDLPQGGTTAGTISARNGWSVSIADLSPGGVVIELSGSGSGPVMVLACAGDADGPEEVWLDGAGAKASVSCAPDTGSTTVRALAAFPDIELRKTAGGLTTILGLAPGQAATIGSPALADPENLEPVRITLADELGALIGSFELDPGESAEAAESAEGVISVTVFSGSVPVTVGDEVVVLVVGESRGFEVCSPLALESLTASPALLWPPNHKMVTVTLSPAWSGTCGTAACRVSSVTSSEPEDGLGDGDTGPDWSIGEGLTLTLRAERAAGGLGRTYSIVVVCVDTAGRTVSKTVTLSVPHER